MSHVSIFRVSSAGFSSSVPPRAGPTSSFSCRGLLCVPLSRMPGFCSFSRMVRRVSRKPGFSSACESPSASSPVSCLPNTVSYAQRTAFSSVSACRRWSASVASVASMRLLKPAASILNHKQQRSRAPTSDARAARKWIEKGCGIARLLGSLWRLARDRGDVLSNNMRVRVVGCD